MDRDTLKALQAPIKQRYQADPATAIAELHATGIVDFAGLSCRVPIPANDGIEIIAGLHPMAGGDGSAACSGDMLLQALVTCAGTTMAVVATAMGLEIRDAHIEADAIGPADRRPGGPAARGDDVGRGASGGHRKRQAA